MLRFTLGAYSRIIGDGVSDMDRYAALVHQLPRRFHEPGREEQSAALAEPAPLTGTR